MGNIEVVYRAQKEYQLIDTILIFNLILGYHMQKVKKEMVESDGVIKEQEYPKQSEDEEGSPLSTIANRHLKFEKNYPKNIFIPLIQHLGERGLKRQYQECVGTRESFQGKNVVSLAQIHKVMSQQWFCQGINLTALVSNMSNKILMNSKIKKKLFHLLLIKELFDIPIEDPREFKKLVSKRASDVSQSKLPDDVIFRYPSALIYLLSLFAQGLTEQHSQIKMGREQLPLDEQSKKFFIEENSHESKAKKEISSKEEYKYYISKIINSLNGYLGEPTDLFDMVENIKTEIRRRQIQIREKYNLPERVPEWSYFISIVINSCYVYKRSKNKLTYSLINQWIQDFKDKSTSLKGFTELEPRVEETEFKFVPIVLVHPPR